jgi:predicted acyl esterase
VVRRARTPHDVTADTSREAIMGTSKTWAAVAAATAVVTGLLSGAPAAADEPSTVVTEQRFTAADGVELQTTLTSSGSVTPKPTVVEFSPYGDGSRTLDVSSDYNYLLVQIRGTGDSDGSFDALGPRSQRDVVEVLDWACRQPFSDGRLALAGFSASAIVLYNSWHQELPCVEAAVLRSGTHELYRDLLVPGGILNLLPGAGVLALIGAPALLQGPQRLARDPATALDVVGGLFDTGLNVLGHPTLDDWWRQRGWRGDANDIPVLMLNGFFDVESRGAFQAYQALRGDGAQLRMVGGHDGHPAGTDGGAAAATAWLDHHVRGVDNGVARQPRVRLLLAEGSREGYLAGAFQQYAADDWPVPGTTWESLALDSRRTRAAGTLVDSALAGGSLTPGDAGPIRGQSHATVPSLPTMSDVPNAALVGAGALDALTGALPLLGDTGVAGLLGLTYTTGPLAEDVTTAGPLALEVPLKTSVPGTGIWAVLSDVAPDGSSHPLTVGRLGTSYPDIDRSASLVVDGQVVQPYGDLTHARPARPGEWRRYHVEMWPVGNRFRAGHRLRIQLLGTSLASLPSLPGIHTIRVGGADGARLLVPVLPGDDLAAALRD